MKTVALLNGPNLNRLGIREPNLYGSTSLQEIIAHLQGRAASLDATILDFQSNHEGELIDRIHQWSDQGVTLGIINPGGFTHTSVALRDAISASSIRFVEVHLSHIHQREDFRHKSLTAPVCAAQISGMGPFGYEAALLYLLQC